MVTVKDWFVTKDYDAGYALLCQHSKNRVLIYNLGKKHNPAKLEYELTKFVKQVPGKIVEPRLIAPIQTAKKQPVAVFVSPPSSSKEGSALDSALEGVVRNNNIDSLPAHLKAKWKFNQDAYKQIRALHEKLKLMEKATDADRQPLTEQIASLDDKIRANWEEIDAWQPGAEPETKEPVTIDHKRINANRKFISINLKKIAASEKSDEHIVVTKAIEARAKELLNAGEMIAAKTILELQKIGIDI